MRGVEPGPGRGLEQGAGPGERRAVSRAVAGGRRARMAEQWDLDEECLRRLGSLNLEQPGRAGRVWLRSGAWLRGCEETVVCSFGSPR